MSPEMGWFAAGMAVAVLVCFGWLAVLIRNEARVLTRGDAADELEALRERRLGVEVTAGAARFGPNTRLATFLRALEAMGRPIDG